MCVGMICVVLCLCVCGGVGGGGHIVGMMCVVCVCPGGKREKRRNFRLHDQTRHPPSAALLCSALCSERDGMVAFPEGDAAYHSAAMTDTLDALIQRSVQLAQKLIAFDQAVSSDRWVRCAVLALWWCRRMCLCV